ncbi:MAG: alkaline phosphatase family protein [Bacteroidetes bacterium]|nr:alkaline phosphatase family protein [Bacteroidota bacterium]
MKKGKTLYAFGLIFFSMCAFAQKKQTIIAFGSCDNQEKPQELWQEIIKQKPVLWIWGGDNIYADTGDTTVLKTMYAKQKSDPGYKQLLKTCPITGTWDDHDYGTNDGGKFWPHRDEFKKFELQFLDIPRNNAVWSRPGIYNSMTYGDGKTKIKVINLDTRYFRDTLVKVYYKPEGSEKKEYKYEVNETGDILGDVQWKWLEDELRNSDAPFFIINSSIQALAEDHRFEKWVNFPKARQRLLDVLAASKKNVLIISGDRHIAEFSKVDLPGANYPLYDFTSSGLTHTWPEKWVEANRYRVGELVIQKNFGIIKIDWGMKDFKVTLQIRGKDNQVFQHQVITFKR